jgi:hypothetical protein
MRIIGSAPGVWSDQREINERDSMNNWLNMDDKQRFVIKRDGAWESPPVRLSHLSGKIRDGGYAIFWVFTIRRPAKYECYGTFQRLPQYFQAVLPEDLYVIWDSSLLFLDPDNYLKEMGVIMDLDLSNAEEIKNPDLKWIENVAT